MSASLESQAQQKLQLGGFTLPSGDLIAPGRETYRTGLVAAQIYLSLAVNSAHLHLAQVC